MNADRRRCLVIAPTFPPSGLPPAHRARLFVRHLRACGWEPVVLTVDARDREEMLEPALLRSVPDDIRIESVRAWPRRLGIGDIALRAWFALRCRAVSLGRDVDVKAVLLIVPPWYALMLAPWIKRRLNVPIVVDYLDPWDVGVPPLRGKRALAGWVARRVEGPSLRAVDGVFAVSDGILERQVKQYPWLCARVRGSAGYGFEPTDLDLINASPAVSHHLGESGTIRVTYVGVVSESQRPVMHAVLEAVGKLNGRITLDCYGTSYTARIPYTQALTVMKQSDANLIIGDLTGYYAASKLMPLLAAERPVVALMQSGTEPARVLAGVGARGLVCYGNAESPTPGDAVEKLTCILQQLMQGQIPALTRSALDATFRERSALRMTESLARVLDAVTA